MLGNPKACPPHLSRDLYRYFDMKMPFESGGFSSLMGVLMDMSV
jgi:hypothetical protein